MMKTAKPKLQPNIPGEPLRAPKWEVSAEKLDSLRDIRKDDEIAIVVDILIRKYGWGYRKGSHRLYRADKQDVPITELKPCEDYFDTEDEIKAYVHDKFGWVGPKGKEYHPPAIKRERKKPQYLDDLPDTSTTAKQRRKRKIKTLKSRDQHESKVPNNGSKATRQRMIVYQFSPSYIEKLNQSYIEKKGIAVQHLEEIKPLAAKKKKGDKPTKTKPEVQHELITPLPVFSSNRVSLQKKRPESPKWV